jgi:predicted aspartyl protease
MIGRANEATGFITLTFLEDGGRTRDFEFVVDTGFDGGGLTLPSNVIDSLGLKLVIDARAEMADGTEVVTNVYQGSIGVDGAQDRRCSVCARIEAFAWHRDA